MSRNDRDRGFNRRNYGAIDFSRCDISILANKPTPLFVQIMQRKEREAASVQLPASEQTSNTETLAQKIDRNLTAAGDDAAQTWLHLASFNRQEREALFELIPQEIRPASVTEILGRDKIELAFTMKVARLLLDVDKPERSFFRKYTRPWYLDMLGYPPEVETKEGAKGNVR